MKQQKWKVWITIGFIAAAALLYGMGRLYQDEGFCFTGNTGRKNAESKAERNVGSNTEVRITQAESGVSEEFVMKTFSDTFFSTVADEEIAKADKRSDSRESIEGMPEDAGTKKSENGDKKLEEGQGEATGRMEAGEEEHGRTGEKMETGGNDHEKAGEHVLWVYVCGEVQNPGVFALAESSRVVDAIEAAGGFTERAAAAYWNLAQMLEDGMKIAVPSVEEVADDPYGAQNPERAGIAAGSGKIGNSAEKEPALVNLNTADAALLQTLPGIGEAKAADIIAYRQKQGRFDSIEDIMKIPGIKDAVFQKIKDKITV